MKLNCLVKVFYNIIFEYQQDIIEACTLCFQLWIRLLWTATLCIIFFVAGKFSSLQFVLLSLSSDYDISSRKFNLNAAKHPSNDLTNFLNHLPICSQLRKSKSPFFAHGTWFLKLAYLNKDCANSDRKNLIYFFVLRFIFSTCPECSYIFETYHWCIFV